ncbi:hypothetical protein SF06_33830 [Pseudomonas flexibilis]|nr:hypothetical protein SF06_33830 [Pseudomonas flexibilis]
MAIGLISSTAENIEAVQALGIAADKPSDRPGSPPKTFSSRPAGPEIQGAP